MAPKFNNMTCPHATNLEHRARVLRVAGRVPKVGGEQAARDRLARARQQPPALHAQAVLLVPRCAAPASQGAL